MIFFLSFHHLHLVLFSWSQSVSMNHSNLTFLASQSVISTLRPQFDNSKYIIQSYQYLRLLNYNSQHIMKPSFSHFHPPQENLTTLSHWPRHESLSLHTSSSNKKKNILCKIAFEIDGNEQQLLIYDNDTLETVTDELVMKLNFVSLAKDQSELGVSQQERWALEEQIKKKIEIIIQSCIDNTTKTQQWKTKLKQFINHPSLEPVKVFMKETIESNQHSNKIKYFAYNTVQQQPRSAHSSQLKNAEIIQRAKAVESSLGQTEQKCTDSLEHTHRLYDLSKKNQAIKGYLSKIRQEHIQQEELHQCTFQPKLNKSPLKTESSQYSKTVRHRDCVFDRLYKQAMEKQEKLKVIERQLSQRAKQEYQHLNFTPSIDSCSRQIINLKKQVSRSNFTSIYDHLYNQTSKKDKKKKINQFSFKPTLCPNSEKIVTKSKGKKKQNQQNFNPKTSVIPSQKEVKTKRKNNPLNQSKEKSPSFLKNFQYLYNDKKSPLSQKRNILKQTKTRQNHSFRTTNNISPNKSLEKRVEISQTCQSITNYPKYSQKVFKNVIDPSFFRDQVSEDGNYFKKGRENLFFLTGKTQSESIKTEVNESITQRKIISAKHEQSGQLGKKVKSKKPLNPFDFFQLQDQKHYTLNQSPLKTISNEEFLSKAVQNKPQMSQNQVFASIFVYLCQKQEQEIQSNFLQKHPQIPSNLFNIFYPMAEQMRQLNVGLDRQEFIWSLTRIFETLSQEQRNSIVSWSVSLHESM